MSERVGRPALAAVSLRFPAHSPMTTSGVARTRGGAWFAAAFASELRIYRWQHDRWRLDGAVQLPEEMPFPGPSTELSFTYVTDALAPDFTAHAWGADTAWFALVARLDGRWRIVPFDDQYRKRDPFTFASGASHHLIFGIFDASGSAGGPTTSQWYRFAHGVFVPTAPPQGLAVCSSTALGAAARWPLIPEDPLLRDIDQSFHPVRFACADGWALATDGRRLSVYEQEGRHWLRVGVGSARLVGTQIEFALPRSLLNRLAHRIHVLVPPAPAEPASNQLPVFTRRQRAPITLRVRPGDSYYPPSSLFDGRPNLLTVTISSPTSGSHVMRFRWRNGAWIGGG
jgi:hypothetical protein